MQRILLAATLILLAWPRATAQEDADDWWQPKAAASAGETPEAYIERRQAELAADDAFGHLELADLARSTGFPEAAARHAQIVLDLEPGKRAEEMAHELLGHTYHKKAWLTPEQAAAEGLLEFRGEWLRPQDHALHVQKSEWKNAWELDDNKQGTRLKTNTSARKAQKYLATFVAFKRDMERTFGIRLKDKYKVNIYATKEEYHTHGGGPRGTGGFYSPAGRDFHFFDDPDFFQARRIFFHEGTHMFVNLTNKNKDFSYPNWLNEGMAEYFGGARLNYEDGTYTFGHILNDRLEVIQADLKAGRHMPLSEFIAQEGLSGAYDQGWSLVLFLQKREGGKYAPQFGKYLDLLRDAKYKMLVGDVRRSDEIVDFFRQLFLKPGQSLDQLEGEWKEWVLQLKPEPGAPDFRSMKSMH